jgi:hypothetical protein
MNYGHDEGKTKTIRRWDVGFNVQISIPFLENADVHPFEVKD